MPHSTHVSQLQYLVRNTCVILFYSKNQDEAVSMCNKMRAGICSPEVKVRVKQQKMSVISLSHHRNICH